MIWLVALATVALCARFALRTVDNQILLGAWHDDSLLQKGQSADLATWGSASPASLGTAHWRRVEIRAKATAVWIRRGPASMSGIDVLGPASWTSSMAAGSLTDCTADANSADNWAAGQVSWTLSCPGSARAIATAGTRTDGTSVVLVDGVETSNEVRNGLVRDLWITAAAVGMVSPLVGWLIAGFITRRLARTRDVAARLGEGDLDARVQVRGSDEVGQLGRQLNAMADRVQESMRSQRQFVSDTAHELRTPTTALLAYASALNDPATRDEAASAVAPQLRRLSTLTEDLLALSRFDGGAEQLRLTEVDIGEVVERAAATVAPPDAWRLRCAEPVVGLIDPARLSVAIRNLVSNGLSHGLPPVVISIDQHANQAVIRIVDAGPGIPEALRERIFDRFVRGETSRHRDDADGAHAGLGLALARENVRLHGGELSLDPAGQGFVITLPLGQPDSPACDETVATS